MANFDFSAPIEESKIYPAEHHFRIITEVESVAEAGLRQVLEEYEVITELAQGRSSSGGRYRVFEVTVRMSSRDEHHKLDAALRAVKGVRILL